MERLPSFNIAAINTLRDRIVERVFIPRYNESPQGSQFEYLVDDLCAALPPGIKRDTVFETCRQLLDIELKPQLSLEFAWRLAGNVNALKAGKPVRPWASQVEDEWVPLQIVRVELGRNQYDELGHFVAIRVLAGSPCPKIIRRFFSRKFSNAMARRLGFSRRQGHYPFNDTLQFVNLRFLGKIEVDKCRDEPKYGAVQCPQSMVDFNRDLLKLRLHITPCPRGYIHPCHQCVIGYATCPAGTHRLDYVKDFCHGCSTDAFFDPDSKSDRCVQCSVKANLKKT